MIFNLGNPYELEKYKEYVNTLYSKRAVVEVKEKKHNRTLKQNAYLHVILSYFACEYGCSVEEAKLDFYKRLCNKDVFLRQHTNKNGLKVSTVRSTSELDTFEMTNTIERFRNWASATAGIYLPSPRENDFLVHCQQVIEKHRNYI